MNAPVFDHQRIDRTDGQGQRIDTVAQGKNRFLMGIGDIATGKLAAAQALEKGFKRVGRHIDGFVGAVNSVFGQPGAINQRGSGNG